MDFGKINSKDAADKGAVLHLKHPVFGHALYVGPGAADDGSLIDRKAEHSPITMIVRGFHSPIVQRAVEKGRKKAVRSDQENEDLGERLIDALIVSWENVIVDGEPLECNRKNKAWLIEQDPGMFTQVNEFAEDRANFFGKKSSS